MQMNWNEALDHYDIQNTVRKEQTYIHLGDNKFKPVDNLYSIVYDDVDDPISGVGVNRRYTCIQTKSYADVGDKITGDLGAEFTRGGFLLGGKGLYLQAKLPDTIRVKGTDDVIDKFITFITDHSGRLCFSILPTGVRLFCENQISALMNDVSGVKIRHTASSVDKIKQADVAILNVMDAYRQLEVKLDWLADTKFTDLQMDLAIKKAFGVKKETENDDIPTRTKNNMEKVKDLFESGLGLSQWRGTSFAAFSAFGEFSDHHRSIRKTTNVFENNLIGSGARFKDKALNAIENVLSA